MTHADFTKDQLWAALEKAATVCRADMGKQFADADFCPEDVLHKCPHNTTGELFFKCPLEEKHGDVNIDQVDECWVLHFLGKAAKP